MAKPPQPKKGEHIKMITSKSGEIGYEVYMEIKDKPIRRRFSPRTTRLHSPTENLKAARLFVAQTELAAQTGQFVASSGTTLAELADAYFLTRRDLREVTVQGYRQALAGVLAVHGTERVQTITEPEVQRWVDAWKTTGGVRGRGLAHRSIVLSLQALSLVLGYGVKTKVLSVNPAQGVKAPRKTAADRKVKIIWTPAQMRQFLDVSDQDEYASGWRLVCSGLRRSEVLGVRWQDVDLETGIVSIRQGRVKTGVKKAVVTDDPKSAASKRDVEVEAIHPGTMMMFRALKTRQAADRLALGGWETDLVVVNEAGEPIHPDTFGTRFRALCKKAGVPVISMHNTRHTIASLLHGDGVAPATAAELLGHEVGTHLTYYVKPIEGAKSAAAARLGGLLAAGGEG